MKKVLAVLLTVLAAQIAPAMAAQRGTPEYDQLVEIKKTQRAEREKKRLDEKTNPQAKPKNFWQREADRSGFTGTGAMFSNAVFNSIPLERPNTGKES